MQTEFQVSLQPYNTFGIDASANQLITLETADDLMNLGKELQDGLVIGGGSNILLTKPRYETVLINKIRGMEIVEEKDDTVNIAVGSGENWHKLVLWTLSHHYGGLENLSLIPGTVGAAPIQNIGAYGVEINDVIVGLDYFQYEESAEYFIPTDECQFNYRDSIFKNEWKDQGLITRVYLRLTKHNHIVNTEYKALKQYLHGEGTTDPTIHQVSQAVISIRQSKLPDWRKIGNAGSFFKNPVVTRAFYENLKTAFPNVPSFPVDEDQVKIPAAWLIEQAGFKGIKMERVGSYKFQPLVLVNYGGATGADVLRLMEKIQTEVDRLFGIFLTPEVTIV